LTIKTRARIQESGVKKIEHIKTILYLTNLTKISSFKTKNKSLFLSKINTL